MRRLLAALVLATALVPAVTTAQDQQSYRFVIIPKVVHPWFDKVHEGARKAAKMIEERTGSKVEIVYSAQQHPFEVTDEFVLRDMIESVRLLKSAS